MWVVRIEDAAGTSCGPGGFAVDWNGLYKPIWCHLLNASSQEIAPPCTPIYWETVCNLNYQNSCLESTRIAVHFFTRKPGCEGCGDRSFTTVTLASVSPKEYWTYPITSHDASLNAIMIYGALIKWSSQMVRIYSELHLLSCSSSNSCTFVR